MLCQNQEYSMDWRVCVTGKKNPDRREKGKFTHRQPHCQGTMDLVANVIETIEIFKEKSMTRNAFQGHNFFSA